MIKARPFASVIVLFVILFLSTEGLKPDFNFEGPDDPLATISSVSIYEIAFDAPFIKFSFDVPPIDQTEFEIESTSLALEPQNSERGNSDSFDYTQFLKLILKPYWAEAIGLE